MVVTAEAPEGPMLARLEVLVKIDVGDESSVVI
jgi:hypothetical protein